MRIISKFKDYYDIGQQYGIGDIVYVRNSQELEKDFINIKLGSSKIKGVSEGSVTIGLVGFCGNWYPFAQFKPKDEEKYKTIKTLHCYGDTYVYDKEIVNKADNVWRWEHKTDIYDAIKNIPIDIFIENNTPIITYCHEFRNYKGYQKITTINDNLRRFQFEQVKDPYTAYQEIEMFVGGILTNKGNTTFDISNNDMRDKKGFDKWSFRKVGANSK